MPTPEELNLSSEALSTEAIDPFAELESVQETEISPETVQEAEPTSKTPEPVEPTPPPSTPTAPIAGHAAPGKDQFLQDIESALSEGLEDIYRQLPPDRRKIFKTRGEKLAEEIRGLLVAAKAEAKRIFQMIMDWLKTLPGVSRFYLEQEAKIKTDKILTAAAEERRRGLLT